MLQALRREPSDRFHILVGTSCNNNCIFCAESRADLLPYKQSDPEFVRRELETHVGTTEVMFAYAEPTLDPSLHTYIRWARDIGYLRIGLTTNGRRLGYEAYTRQLLENGLNHLVVSIHGPDARTHDAQTRCPGSFDQTMEGLRTATRLRQQYPVELHSSTVISLRNFARIAEIYAILRPFALEQHVFNVIQPLGRAAQRTRQLMARYTDVASEFGRFLDFVRPPRPRLYLVDIPFCTTERLPPEVRGDVEPAFFSSVAPDCHVEERRVRMHKHGRHAEKHQDCMRCDYERACFGVWLEYTCVYGWDEFVPVKANAPEKGGNRRTPS